MNLLRWLAAPKFDDPEKTRISGILHVILAVIFLGL
jgi:hypothetical protein